MRKTLSRLQLGVTAVPGTDPISSIAPIGVAMAMARYAALQAPGPARRAASGRPVCTAFALVSVSFHWNNILWPLIITHSVNAHTPTVGLQVFSSCRPGDR
jgi:hypothetical protein